MEPIIGVDLWQESSGSCKNDLKSNVNTRDNRYLELLHCDLSRLEERRRTAPEKENSKYEENKEILIESLKRRDTSDSLPVTRRDKISRSKALVSRIRYSSNS